MKICKSLSLSAIVCFWLTGCTHQSDKQMNKSTELVETKTVSLPLGDQTPNWASDCQYYYDKKQTEIILYYTPITKILYLYDLRKGKLIDKIKFIEEGPESVPEPMAVQMLSPDSILVATSYTKQLFLINSKGAILGKYEVVGNKELSQNWRSEPSSKFYVYNGICVFETTPLASPQDAMVYYKTPLGASRNLKSGKSWINYIQYPKEYQTGNYWTLFHNMQHMAFNKQGRIITSYPICRTIQIMDTDGRNLTEHEAGSGYFNSPTQPMKSGINGRDHFLRENSYGAIYYDSYRNVYYRIASQGIKDNLPKVTGPIVPATFMPTSIIILDSTLTKIGETRLPLKKHFFFNMFVGKDGLYISNSNPDNPFNKENQVSFTCYKLIQR